MTDDKLFPYDFAEVALYVGGRRISGLGPDWLRFTPGPCHAVADTSPPCRRRVARCGNTGGWIVSIKLGDDSAPDPPMLTREEIERLYGDTMRRIWKADESHAKAMDTPIPYAGPRPDDEGHSVARAEREDHSTADLGAPSEAERKQAVFDEMDAWLWNGSAPRKRGLWGESPLAEHRARLLRQLRTQTDDDE